MNRSEYRKKKKGGHSSKGDHRTSFMKTLSPDLFVVAHFIPE